MIIMHRTYFWAGVKCDFRYVLMNSMWNLFAEFDSRERFGLKISGILWNVKCVFYVWKQWKWNAITLFWISVNSIVSRVFHRQVFHTICMGVTRTISNVLQEENNKMFVAMTTDCFGFGHVRCRDTQQRGKFFSSFNIICSTRMHTQAYHKRGISHTVPGTIFP